MRDLAMEIEDFDFKVIEKDINHTILRYIKCT
jgi:hypothetical protein